MNESVQKSQDRKFLCTVLIWFPTEQHRKKGWYIHFWLKKIMNFFARAPVGPLATRAPPDRAGRARRRTRRTRGAAVEVGAGGTDLRAQKNSSFQKIVFKTFQNKRKWLS